MSTISSNISMGTSLSISVSGTANIQRALGSTKSVPEALKALSKGPVSTPASVKETATSSLAKASQQTLDAILGALQLYDPKASLSGYKDGQQFRNAQGYTLDLIA